MGTLPDRGLRDVVDENIGNISEHAKRLALEAQEKGKAMLYSVGGTNSVLTSKLFGVVEEHERDHYNTTQTLVDLGIATIEKRSVPFLESIFGYRLFLRLVKSPLTDAYIQRFSSA